MTSAKSRARHKRWRANFPRIAKPSGRKDRDRRRRQAKAQRAARKRQRGRR